MKRIFAMLGKVVSRIFLISLPTLISLFLLAEIGLRLAVPISDSPLYRFQDDWGLIGFEPNQEGRWIKGGRGEILNARYHINAQGWNARQDYSEEKAAGVVRIAVIGDSYVEALSLDYDKNFAPILEDALNAEHPNTVQVYSFGQSGAPLSQYLHLMRYTQAVYQPDIFIINIVSNDFDESYADLVRKPEFLQVQLDNAGQIVEIPPRDSGFSQSFQGKLSRLARHTAVGRYVYRNLTIISLDVLRDRLKEIASGDNTPAKPAPGAVPNEVVPFDPKMVTLVKYVFQEIAQIARSSGSRVLLIVDPPDYAYQNNYSEAELAAFSDFSYVRMVRETAEQESLPVLDLLPYFRADYTQNSIRLEIEGDLHWNEYAHHLVAMLLAERLKAEGWLAQ